MIKIPERFLRKNESHLDDFMCRNKSILIRRIIVDEGDTDTPEAQKINYIDVELCFSDDEDAAEGYVLRATPLHVDYLGDGMVGRMYRNSKDSRYSSKSIKIQTAGRFLLSELEKLSVSDVVQAESEKLIKQVLRASGLKRRGELDLPNKQQNNLKKSIITLYKCKRYNDNEEYYSLEPFFRGNGDRGEDDGGKQYIIPTDSGTWKAGMDYYGFLAMYRNGAKVFLGIDEATGLPELFFGESNNIPVLRLAA